MPENLVKVTIDGREIEVPKDTMILEAAHQLNIHIPTFCNVDALEPYGVCRICIVEVNEGRKPRLVPSCVYPIRRPATIFTNSEKVAKHRKMLISLILARCPQEQAVIAMAHELGVDAPPARFTKKNDDCILCGLCVRACREVVKASALGFEGRGEKRKAVTPFESENPVCIACGACVFVCPTSCITLIDKDGKRTLPRWKREVPQSELKDLTFSMLPPGVKPNVPGKA